MREHRIYCSQPLHRGEQVLLDEGAARHLTQVLRLKSGAEIVLFDGSGHDYAASLLSAGRRECVAKVGECLGEEALPPLHLHLAIGISRGERMDFSIQKAVELGVSEITPLFSARSMVQLKGERLYNRLEHWRGVIRHACEQSGRSRLPQLHAAVELPRWLDDFQGDGLMLDHRADTPLVDLPPPQGALTLLVGPEGGLSPEERELAQQHRLRGVRMGPRVLRTETAPLAALAVIQALWGDFHD